MKLRKTLAVSAAAFLLLAGCSSDGDDTSTADKGDSDIPVEVEDLPDVSDESDSGVESATIVVDGETIDLSGGSCDLEPQDVATGGQLLFVGKAAGVTADGEDITLKVTGWDEESAYGGDVVEVVFGDFKGPDSVTFSVGLYDGQVDVALDGSTLSAGDTDVTDEDSDDQMTVSFEINC